MQLDSEESDIKDWLQQHLPIISHIGTLECPSSEFLIDEQTRRVCTYLRAYDDQTINRKFVAYQKCLVFLLDESGSMAGSKANEAVDNMIRLFDSHVQIGDVSSRSKYHVVYLILI